MKVNDAAWMGLGALRQHPLQALLSTLGVVIGVAALVAVLSLGDGLETFARVQLEQTTSLQAVGLSPKLTYQRDGVSLPVEHVVAFRPEHLDALVANPFVARGVLQTGGAALASRPNLPDSSRGVAVTALIVTGSPVDEDGILAGRELTSTEVRSDSSLVVVSEALARWIGQGTVDRALHRRIRLGDRLWEIVGVTKSGPRDLLRAQVPFSVIEHAIVPSPTPRITTLVLEADRLETVDSVVTEAHQWLAAQDPRWSDLVDVTSMQVRLRQAQLAIRIFKSFMAAIAAISLLVGGIGIMNILLASVAERTREIGIRKAIGARRRDIIWQFLSESLAITVTGSVIGMLAGLGMSFLATAIMRARTEAPIYSGLSLSTVLIAGAGGILLGLLFGTYPARHAASLAPVDAIRHE